MTGTDDLTPTDASRLSALADPLRLRLYGYVAGHGTPVGRDEAASSAGISRTLAAYHLDRLTDAGLLVTSYARPDGRTGPGAGRPAKHYERAQREVAITIPPRSYDLLARLLAGAVAADTTGLVTSALMTAAEHAGRTASNDDSDLMTSLRTRAYEPVVTGTGAIELRNCPFHQIAQDHTLLVCSLNHALIRGTLTGRGDNPDRAEPSPCPGRCCVVIQPSVAGPSGTADPQTHLPLVAEERCPAGGAPGPVGDARTRTP